ncbi:uncharacterized protein CCOS01_14107 [Colletotrichum costaricense]|uniref:FAD/NAD(P)-binding domain-containing protein n=1 Tax=Colletotrichum costaricense TaxID=1209916 RepID=A0AAJ0DUQ3_9PEZI|nr:uncharacterized protein CCOS01_14107 [Colletotrichum costaricense]KAK1514167.1 hypothetical protein CCOS01_14107 [Colletotrichum costaricense]
MAKRILRPALSAARRLILRASPRLDLPLSSCSSPPSCFYSSLVLAQPRRGESGIGSSMLGKGFVGGGGIQQRATLTSLSSVTRRVQAPPPPPAPARQHQLRSDAGPPLGFRRTLSLCLLLSMRMFSSATATASASASPFASSLPSLASTCLPLHQASPLESYSSNRSYSSSTSTSSSSSFSHSDVVVDSNDSSTFPTTADKMGSLPGAIPPFKVFVIGGLSYAGVSTTLNLLDLSSGKSPRLAHIPYEHHPDFKNVPVEITLVDERDGFFHLIGSPLAFADSKYAAKSWVKFEDIASLQRPNVRFVQGSVSKVDPATKTATVLDHATKQPQDFSYDFLVAASGLRRVFPVVPQSLTRKQYLLEAEEQIDAVRNAPDGVVVVGGGAVGIEMAAELKLVEPDSKVTLVHSRDKLLSSEGLSDECKDKALELTREAGVNVLLNHRVKETRKLDPLPNGRARHEIEFTNGDRLVASEVVMAISRSVPSTDYLPAAAKDEEGYVKIHPNMVLKGDGNVPNAEDHIIVGDICLWPGIKRCGTAMHMGHYAAINAHQLMLAKLTSGAHKPTFSELGPVEPMIGLAIGKKAVASGPVVGTTWGEDVMHAYFRDDLGFTICWNHLGLGRAPDS